MPTDLFYTVNYSIAIVTCIIGIVFGCLVITIIVSNRRCHTINKILICDMCIAMIIYFVLFFIGSIFGLRESWFHYHPACIFRAYLALVACCANSYSLAIQAINRLFFAILYNRRYLLTWRTHWIMIVLKWFISFSIATGPFFFEHGFEYGEEYRSCGLTSKVFTVSLYAIIAIFVIPVTVIIIIYGRIFYQVRQSTRRVNTLITANRFVPNIRQHLRRIRKILIPLTIIIMFGGIPFLILSLWNAINSQSVPQALYLLSVISVTFFSAIMMITVFVTSKMLRSIAFRYVRHFCQPIRIEQ